VHVHEPYEYAIVRLVPRVDREEFVNVGVILRCASRGFLDACVELDESRVRALAPSLDLQLVRAHLDSFVAIARGGKEAGPIGQLTSSERFHWLVATRSTMIQTSAVHTGRCTNPESKMRRLIEEMVKTPE
jgi:Protein of unknown function (DUF3037)